MKKFTLAIVVALLTLGTTPPSFSHGGGLDWQGGHNCRVGSCAGTYHCHQARAGACAPSSEAPKTKPRVSQKVTVQCIDESDEDLNRNQVAMIQFRLKELGYEAGTQDGNYGGLTIKALNKFEIDYKLKKSSKSIIENETLDVLGTRC